MKYFRCDGCGHQCCCPESLVKRMKLMCAALVDSQVRNGKVVPVKCGGNLKEISEEEAMGYV